MAHDSGRIIWVPSQPQEPRYQEWVNMNNAAQKAALRSSTSQPNLSSQPTPSMCNSKPFFDTERSCKPPSTAGQPRKQRTKPTPSTTPATESTTIVDRLMSLPLEQFGGILKRVNEKTDENINAVFADPSLRRVSLRVGPKQRSELAMGSVGRPGSSSRGKERERPASTRNKKPPALAKELSQSQSSASGSNSSDDSAASFFFPGSRSRAVSMATTTPDRDEDDDVLMPPPPVPNRKAAATSSSPRKPLPALDASSLSSSSKPPSSPKARAVPVGGKPVTVTAKPAAPVVKMHAMLLEPEKGKGKERRASSNRDTTKYAQPTTKPKSTPAPAPVQSQSQPAPQQQPRARLGMGMRSHSGPVGGTAKLNAPYKAPFAKPPPGPSSFKTPTPAVSSSKRGSYSTRNLKTSHESDSPPYYCDDDATPPPATASQRSSTSTSPANNDSRTTTTTTKIRVDREPGPNSDDSAMFDSSNSFDMDELERIMQGYDLPPPSPGGG